MCINFQIGYGEYNNERQGLYFDNFCKIHKLSKLKTFNALKTLQSYGVLIFERVLKKKLTIQFLISNNTLQSLFEKDTLEKNVINVMLRTYEGIFVQPTIIDIEKIASKTELKTSTVLEVLERLKFMKVIKFKNSNTDTQITFLVSREDEKTIHRISKPVLIQNKIKLKKLNAVFKYMENNSACKSLQLLNYFDEKVSIPCGICNVCTENGIMTNKFSKKEIRHVLQAIEKVPLSTKDLVKICNLEDETIIKILQYLIKNQKIKLTNSNLYKIL